MDRLMVVLLESHGCAAEVQLNGMPLAALPAAGGRSCLAVHEYTLAGRNQLSLQIGPPPPGQAPAPQPRVAVAPVWARARLVLLRIGQSPLDPNARLLGSIDWLAEAGQTYELPTLKSQDLDLPVAFPRWRWLDAPAVALAAPLQRLVLEFVQQLALELSRGHPDAMLSAARLRFEELALAYQHSAAEGMQRFRDRLQQLYADKALKIVPPAAEELVLRPLAGGRLLECVTPLGAPVLRTQNDEAAAGNQAWPIRIAVVEGKIYVLR